MKLSSFLLCMAINANLQLQDAIVLIRWIMWLDVGVVIN